VVPKTLKLTSSDEVLRTQFLALKTPEELAQLLEVPDQTLRFYLYKNKKYHQFAINKSSGKIRLISAPATRLKLIQRKLSQVLYAVYGSRSPVHGFARGRSVRSNAVRHLGCRWMLNFDIEDFFPSIHFGRVVGMFTHKPYGLPKKVAETLARICCHDGKLPAGAPTSPIIANMVCAKMDAALKALAWSSGCAYTRYADDITFSTRGSGFPEKIVKPGDPKSWAIGDDIASILTEGSFSIHPTKSRLRGPTARHEVTGVRINSGLNVKKKLDRQIRAMLHAWEKFGELKAQEDYLKKFHSLYKMNEVPKFRDVVRGKIDFLGFIKGRDSLSYVTYLQRLQVLAPEVKAKSVRVGTKTHERVIRQSIWLLRDKDENIQGTAFAISQNRLLTAAHVMDGDDFMFASRPSFSPSKYVVSPIWKDLNLDIAVVEIPYRLPVHLEVVSATQVDLMSHICVAGFPNYHEGDSVAFRFGQVVQSKMYVSVDGHVQHYVTDADIVVGNSGGPVLDKENKIVGIAVKGLKIAGTLSDDDQLSSFVPINKGTISSKYL
jgi:RNA-directed DNA polymerase